MGNRFYTLQTRDSLNQCFWGGSFVSTVTFSALNRTENIISRSKLWLGWCMFHLRLLIFWTEGNVYLQSPAPTLIPGSRKNRSLLFYALKKTRALLFCTQHEKPRHNHVAVLYCAICPDTVMDDRNNSESSNVVKQSKRALTRTFVHLNEKLNAAPSQSSKAWKALQDDGRVADVAFTKGHSAADIGRLLLASFPSLLGGDLKR